MELVARGGTEKHYNNTKIKVVIGGWYNDCAKRHEKTDKKLTKFELEGKRKTLTDWKSIRV